MKTFKCQNCGAEVPVSDLCVTQPDDFICYTCADQDVTIELVKKAKELNHSTQPTRIIHVTKEVIH